MRGNGVPVAEIFLFHRSGRKMQGSGSAVKRILNQEMKTSAKLAVWDDKNIL